MRCLGSLYYGIQAKTVHYLYDWQVLSVDHWGLPPSLLPSLAASAASALDLRPYEDQTVLNLVCEQRRRKGCCPLVAGTPKGLMAYLYAR